LTIVVFGSLLMTLTVGGSSISVSAEKLNQQARARAIMDWVSRDLRNAISWEINANNPTSNYVKFNLWSWDTAANTWKLGDQFVEYSYNSATSTLSRRLLDNTGTVLQETDFPDVILSPFYTSYTDEFTNQFDKNVLLASRQMILVIRTHHAARGRDVSSTLIENIKIRNG
ncbi:MAG: hypothetical protein ACM3OC_04410, partial [Deltaproteobacteria bacterium]